MYIIVNMVYCMYIIVKMTTVGRISSATWITVHVGMEYCKIAFIYKKKSCVLSWCVCVWLKSLLCGVSFEVIAVVWWLATENSLWESVNRGLFINQGIHYLLHYCVLFMPLLTTPAKETCVYITEWSLNDPTKQV